VSEPRHRPSMCICMEDYPLTIAQTSLYKVYTPAWAGQHRFMQVSLNMS